MRYSLITLARKRATCKYFKGIQNTCVKELDPMDTRDLPQVGPARFACIRIGTDTQLVDDTWPACAEYVALTDEDIAAQEAETDRLLNAIASGFSPCCGALLDKTQVITQGKYQGHGPVFCPDCKTMIYRV